MCIKSILSILFICNVFADLRMASSPKKNFKVENGKNSIPFIDQSIAFYMEPSDFNYAGLKNQRENNFDNFLRSNIDNEQDNRNFQVEIGRDMLPFRTFESSVVGNNLINTTIGQQNFIPLRWNNPHSSECEINIWIKSNLGDNIVVPIKKPSCCAEGYQDNMLSFVIPSDFNELSNKVPGFTGCNNIGDCILQIYAHSVEPRTYSIGTPIVITSSDNPIKNYNNMTTQIQPATFDPLLNLNYLTHETCIPTNDPNSNIQSAIPRFARLVSDQFNHAYQNSNYSPYSGQQHESISKNLQAATILRMTAANGGELGKSILTNDEKEFIQQLINKVNNVVEKYEQSANDIFNMIKNNFKRADKIGNQQLANCFRCSETGSVNTKRIEQKTYIPSFEIPDDNLANNIRNNLKNNVKNLIPNNSRTVQIYVSALNEMQNDFKNAETKGFIYQPAMIKSTILTMNDVSQFLKIDQNGNPDNGVYASKIAKVNKLKNIENIITNSLGLTTSPLPSYSSTVQPSTEINLPTSSPGNTIPPNPDDYPSDQLSNFCGKSYETVNCNAPCPSGMDYECNEIDVTCFHVVTNICQ